MTDPPPLLDTPSFVVGASEMCAALGVSGVVGRESMVPGS